jgi:sugar phosphate isomerase/epimerase
MTTPRFAISQFSTPDLSLAEALQVYADAGVEGIGLSQVPTAEDVGLIRASGLQVTSSFPAVQGVLPLADAPGAADPSARVEQLCASIRDLAAVEPVCVVVVTGPLGTYEPDEARELAVTGLQRIARVAADVGITVAIEPMHTSIAAEYSWIDTLPAAIELLDDVGEPNTGVLFDIWHLWDTPGVLDHVRTHAGRFVDVHVDDRRDPTRSWCDRVLPGDGIAGVRSIFAALEDGGYDGWYELEVISDDGRHEDDFADSLWKRDPLELAREARERFAQEWGGRRAER